jgi:hypothetical protein
MREFLRFVERWKTLRRFGFGETSPFGLGSPVSPLAFPRLSSDAVFVSSIEVMLRRPYRCFTPCRGDVGG